MATLHTHTLTVTIDAPLAQVAADLADPTTHPSWATEFYAGPVRPTEAGEFIAPVPMMGGEVRHRIDADIARGIVDLYYAPPGAPYGPPLPVRLVPNRDGVDVLWTLARFPGVSDQAWQQGLAAMARELQALKRRHETRTGTNASGTRSPSRRSTPAPPAQEDAAASSWPFHTRLLAGKGWMH